MPQETPTPAAPKGRILLIDDEEIMHDVITTLLMKEQYELDAAFDGDAGLELFSSKPYDLVLLDLMLPGKDGFAILKEIRQLDPHAVVIMITADSKVEHAVQSVKDGAYDFVAKPFKNEKMLLVIKNGLHKRALEMENLYLRQSFQAHYSFDSIIGKSHAMKEIFRLIQQVAPTKSTVLITGESGTGKELVAKAIHNCSLRAEHPFIPLNCGNIPAELLESELFGYRKGAFTGAVATKKGLFEAAEGGTLFLDEIGNLSMELQAKLLRVIQEREFRRLGDVESLKVDVRILAATNEDLKDLVSQGRFREDLFYRLNVIKISLPPLRDRRDDIPILVEHFIQQYCRENGKKCCSLDKSAMEILMDHDWPGNVRELENVLERAVVLCGDETCITPDLFPPEVIPRGQPLAAKPAELPPDGLNLKDAVSDYERSLILSALEKTGGSQKRAAQLLGLNATTLNEKIKRLGIRAFLGTDPGVLY